MAKRDFAFGKENFILIAIAVVVIAIGLEKMLRMPDYSWLRRKA